MKNFPFGITCTFSALGVTPGMSGHRCVWCTRLDLSAEACGGLLLSVALTLWAWLTSEHVFRCVNCRQGADRFFIHHWQSTNLRYTLHANQRSCECVFTSQWADRKWTARGRGCRLLKRVQLAWISSCQGCSGRLRVVPSFTTES